MLNIHPTETRIWFFNTQIEDQDTYRFLEESESLFKHKIEIFTEGRNPWQIFNDERFIGNSRITPCTRVLKRQFLEKLLKKAYPDNNIVLCFGITKEEKERAIRIKNSWSQRGIKTTFPLINKFGIDKSKFFDNYGIKIPRLYKFGFPHNNCGGGCVKAGIGQWVNLYRLFPKRFLWHEEQEILTRKYLKKDVAILRDRHGGYTKPLTLFDLRKRIEE